MSEMYLGTIVIWPISYATDGTMFCQGQALPVSQSGALYSLLANTYGGNTINFLLPDLRARMPIGTGQGQYFSPPPPVTLGQTVGAALATGSVASNGSIVLTTDNLPAHTHQASFTPVTSSVTVPISQAGSLGVNIPVGVSVPSSITPNPLSGPQYLNNGASGATAFKGGFVNSPPASPVFLATGTNGVTVTGTPGVTANPTVNVVTGGSVSVFNTGAGAAVPVRVTGTFSASNLQPSLGLNFLMFTNGLYPVRP